MASREATNAAAQARQLAVAYVGGAVPLMRISDYLMRCVPHHLDAPGYFITFIKALIILGLHGNPEPVEWVERVLAEIEKRNNEDDEFRSYGHRTPTDIAGYLALRCLRCLDKVNEHNYMTPDHVTAYEVALYDHMCQMSMSACNRLFDDPYDSPYYTEADRDAAAAAANAATVVFINCLKSGCSAADSFDTAMRKFRELAPAAAAAPPAAAAAPPAAAAAPPAAVPAPAAVLAPAAVPAPAAAPDPGAVFATHRKRRGVCEPSPAATGDAAAERDAEPSHKSMRTRFVDLTGDAGDEDDVLDLTVPGPPQPP